VFDRGLWSIESMATLLSWSCRPWETHLTRIYPAKADIKGRLNMGRVSGFVQIGIIVGAGVLLWEICSAVIS